MQLPAFVRKSLRAELPAERRIARFDLPPCPTCGTTAVSVVSRTDDVLYLRCGLCGAVSRTTKPGVAAFGT